MKKPVIAMIAALVALAALIAGCGSSSSSTESTEGGESPAVTKAEFIKQANSICETSEKQGEKEVEEFAKEEGIEEGEEPNEEVQERLAEEVVIPTLAAQMEEIRAIGFPEGSDGEEAEEIVGMAEENVEEAEEEPTMLFNGEVFKETNKKAREYGLTVCGSES